MRDRESEFDEVLKRWPPPSPEADPNSPSSAGTRTTQVTVSQPPQHSESSQPGGAGAFLPSPPQESTANVPPGTKRSDPDGALELGSLQFGLFPPPAQTGVVVERSAARLRPHPAMSRLGIGPSEERLRDLESLGATAFGADLRPNRPLDLPSCSAAGNRTDVLWVKRSETAMAASAHQTSGAANLLPSPEAPPGGFSLTPPPIPPRISFVKIQRIHPHLAVRALGYNPTAVELEPVRQHWETAHYEPLIVTDQGTIIDGHKRWVVARERGIATLPCVMLAISDDEALNQILARASAKNWWKPYRRICQALTREDALREQARENQRAGGRKKDPSTLTKAQHIDVRGEIARMAGTGTGSVTKVKRIFAEGCPLLKQEALRGAISIDTAWKISKLDHDEQMRELGRRASKRRGRKRVQALGRAAAIRSERVSEHPRERFGQIRQLFDELTRSGPLEKFRDPSLELLARMERELDVYESDMAMSRASAQAVETAEAD